MPILEMHPYSGDFFMGQQTPFYSKHVAANGKIVDFSGWDMPIHYGSQIEEHHQVRSDAGLFDVAHMTIIDFKGKQCTDFLQYLLANDIAKLKTSGKALYSCMLNEQAGVIDDLITYYMDPQWYRMVVNAATRDKDLAWINAQAKDFDITITERQDLAMVAVQGPNARDKAASCLPNGLGADALALKAFVATAVEDWFVARTGYTGEDGFEIIFPAREAEAFWDQLVSAGIAPTGLGARDTLRLEAGMNLYGTDMDETITPLEAGLEWTVAWHPEDREFIGREALTQKKQTPHDIFVGLFLEDRGVLRNGLTVYVDGKAGQITSGSFSPTMGKAIAFARIPASDATQCEVEIRGKRLPARIVKPPFVRHGKTLV
jgi:aminomethyltransferase